MLMAVGWGLLRHLRPRGRGLDEDRRALLVATVFGASLFVTLYPRVDTMHLIVAMPSSLVVAAAVTRRMVVTWAWALGVPRIWMLRAVVGGAAALAVVAIVPNGWGLVEGRRNGWVVLPSPRAPVRVEATRATDLVALGDLLDDLQGRRRPGDRIFGFPAMALVPFALGALTPTPHDYFFPGRPDHADEAEIVRLLADDPPPFVVTLNRRFGFFSESPAYYFMLRRHLRDHYRLAARYGRYDLLVPQEVAPHVPRVVEYRPPPKPGGVFERLSDPDREQRRAAIEPVLEAVARDGARLDDFAATDTERLLVLRNIAEVSDSRGLPLAWAAYGVYGRRVSTEAAGALNFIALHDRHGRYALADDVAAAAREMPPALPMLDREKLRNLVRSQDLRPQIGLFAAWALGRLKDPEAAPVFEMLIEQETRRPLFQVLGAEGLTALGRPEAPCRLVDLLAQRKHDTQNTPPSFLLALAARRPAIVSQCLRAGLQHAGALAREVSAWIAGAADLRALAPAIRPNLADEDADVRMASLWALGRFRDSEARDAVAALTAGGRREAAFAVEALERIEGDVR
jgi:hypothetical protein